MSQTVGRPIDIGDSLSRSARLVIERPALMVPQSIALVLSLAGVALGGSPLGYPRLALGAVSGLVAVIIAGAYPSMVQAALAGAALSAVGSMRMALRRFWTLLGAGVLVGLIVFLGSFVFMVPAIVFATWYVYTVPAVMLENRGALAGMAASKAFGRDKKLSTFAMFLILLVVGIAIFAIGFLALLGSSTLGTVTTSLLSVPLGAWEAVLISYVYVTYGPSSVPAAGASTWATTPLAATPQPPPVPPGVAPARFCRFCGSPLEPDSKFCGACGSALIPSRQRPGSLT